MTEETTMEEIERLNPQFNWDPRKIKKIIKWRAAQLAPNHAYAMGCRGHPGLVIERNYDPRWSHWALCGADVSIKSLVDGIEESCSIWHCAPMAISKEEAERRAEEIRTIHDFDLSIMYGHSVEDVQEWWNDWRELGVSWYVLHDQDGSVVRSSQAFTKDEAEEEIARGNRMIAEGWWKGITNLRMVDMTTYPAPPKLFDLTEENS